MENTEQPIIRETTYKHLFQENGEIKEKDSRIRYRSLSVKALKEQKQMIADKGEDAYLSDVLFLNLENLPDLIGGPGQPPKLTLEFLEEMDLTNLKRIKTAVDNDLDPK